MPSIKNKTVSSDHEDNFDENPEEYLKKLPLETFLKCNTTHSILESEHYWKFERKLLPQLESIYCDYNNSYNDKVIFSRDPDKILSLAFANLIYDYLVKKYDLSIFYDNPGLAEPLFTSHDK